MSRIVLFTWPGGGNQPPAIGMAQELARHGHSVRFAGYPGQVERFVGLGLELTPLTCSSRGWRPVDPSTVMSLLADRVWACTEHPADVQEVLARERPDLLIVDCLMLGVLAAAEAAAIPTVVLVHSAPGAIAPPGGPFDTMTLPAANAIRGALGLDPVDTVWGAWQPHQVVAASIPDLDPLAAHLPETFRDRDRFTWIGPVVEDPTPNGTTPKGTTPSGAETLEQAGARPLVLVSFSTGPAWDQTSRIQRTIDALAGDDLRVLVTAGTVDISSLRVPTDTVTVVPSAPHTQVLPHTRAVVTHAGHGTLTAALSHALPVVTLPNQAADQPALAQQVAKLGAGLNLDGDHATAEQIQTAVHQILHITAHQAAAASLANHIHTYRGAQTQLPWLPE